MHIFGFLLYYTSRDLQTVRHVHSKRLRRDESGHKVQRSLSELNMKPGDAVGGSDQWPCEQSHLSIEVLFHYLTALGCRISDCNAGLQQTEGKSEESL